MSLSSITHFKRITSIFLILAGLVSCGGGSPSNQQLPAEDGDTQIDSPLIDAPVVKLVEGEGFSLAPGLVSTQVSGFAEAANGDLFASIFYNTINWGVIKSSDDGANWAVIDSFQRFDGRQSISTDLLIDTNSNIFVSGFSKDDGPSTGVFGWVIRKSSDNGGTFATSDVFSLTLGYHSKASGLVTSSNAVYAYGYSTELVSTNPDVTQSKGIVRKSTDAGSSWQTVFNIEVSSIVDMAVAQNGDLYILDSLWRLHKSVDNGVSWITGAAYAGIRTQRVGGLAIASDNTVYVVGTIREPSDQWRLLSTTDLGANWNVLADYAHPIETETVDAKIIIAANGDIYLAGDGANKRIIVRRSTDNGASWTTSLDYQSDVNTYNDFVRNIALDADGNVVVLGTANAEFGIFARFDILGNATVSSYQPQLPSPSAAIEGFSPAGNTFVVAGVSRDLSTSNTEWLVRKTIDGGISWQIIDHIVNGANYSQPTEATQDVAGNYYVAGNSNGAWFIRRSQDGGTSWSNVEDCVNTSDASTFFTMTKNQNGQIFTAGHYSELVGADTERHLFICTSSDNGTTWSLLNDSVHTDIDSPQKMLVRNNTIYFFYSNRNYPDYEWYMKVSTDNGISWTKRTIRAKTLSGYMGSRFDVDITVDGDIYFVGHEVDQDNFDGHWMTFRTADEGLTWQLVDDYFDTDDSTNAFPSSVTFDSQGNIYVLGSAQFTTEGPYHQLVRKSMDSGQTWQILDNWLPSETIWSGTQMKQLIIDSDSRGLTVGTLGNKNYFSYWYERFINLN